jgi:hypothetical protein
MSAKSFLHILLGLSLAGATVLGFQNCSSGFQSASQKLDSGSNFRLSSLEPTRIASPSNIPNTDIYIPPANGGEGMNTMLVSHYTYSKYGKCTDCPGWIGPMDLATIKKSLALVGGTSLNHYREIIEASAFFPAKGQLARVDDLIEILKLYQAQNATLVLSLGTPIPSWMNPELAVNNAISYKPNDPNLFEGGRICFLPKSEAVWSVLKDNMSRAFGDLIKALWDDPRMNRTWIAAHLVIDPINEFDSFPGGPDCKLSDIPFYATGKRAAELTGGIQYVLNHYGIPVIVTSPSGVTGNIDYFADFYKYGGQAMPNVHAYFARNGVSADDPQMNINTKNKLIEVLKKVRDVTPEPYKNHLMLGEFGGFHTANKYCPASAVDAVLCRDYLQLAEAHESYLLTILNDPEIKALAPVRMVWKMVDSPEASYQVASDQSTLSSGFIRADGSPKPSLYNYLLKKDNIDLTHDRARLGDTYARAANDLTVPGKSLDNAILSAFLHEWIYETASWTDLVAKYHSLEDTRAPAQAQEDICASSPGTELCQAYQALFGRRPDDAGFAYWRSALTSDGVTPKAGFPKSCWKHQIVKGISGSECSNYLAKFAPKDAFGKPVGWMPSAGCPLPKVPGNTPLDYYSVPCFVFPADAQMSCSGSPDPGGTITLDQSNLCRAYSELYNRAPDPGGYNYWLSQLKGKSLACMKKALAPGTSSSDCGAYRSNYGLNAPSVACGNGPSNNFGCQ